MSVGAIAEVRLRRWITIEGLRVLDKNGLIVTITEQGRVRGFRVSNAEPVPELFARAPIDRVGFLRYAADETRALLMTPDLRLLLVDGLSGELIREVEGPGSTAAAVALADNRRIFVARGGTISAIDPTTGREVFVSTPPPVNGFTPDVDNVLVDAAGRNIVITDVTGNIYASCDGEIRRLQGLHSEASALGMHPASACFAHATRDSLQLVDLETRETRTLAVEVPIQRRQPRLPTRVVFSPDASRIAIAFDDGSVRILDAASGRALHDLPVRGSAIANLGFASNEVIVLGIADGTMEIRELASPNPRAVVDFKKTTTRSYDRSAPVLEISEEPAYLPLMEREFPWWGFGFTAIDPVRALLFIHLYDGPLGVFELAGGALREAHVLGCSISDLVSAPEGRRITSWTSNGIVVADLERNTFDVLPGRAHLDTSVFSPAGDRLYAVSDIISETTDALTGSQLRAFDVGEDGRLGEPVEARVEYRWARCCAISPDGSRLAIGWFDGWLTVHDTESLTLLQVQKHEREVTGMTAAPDGRRFAASDDEGFVVVFDVDGMKHVEKQNSVWIDRCLISWSPDGSTIAVGAAGRAWILLVDAGTLEVKSLIQPPPSGILHALAFRPNGALLAVGASIAGPWLWDLEIRDG